MGIDRSLAASSRPREDVGDARRDHGSKKERTALFAAGLGLVWQAALTMVFDFVAEERALRYADAIARWVS